MPKKKIVAGISLVAILILIYLIYPSHPLENVARPAGAMRYFSTDDGKTWFADEATKLAPFRKDGKDAVRAYVFKCADGKKFIAFLERLTPEGKKKVEAIRSRGAGAATAAAGSSAASD